MKRKKYLSFYKKYYGKRMPKDGLCLCFLDDKLLELMEPTFTDDLKLKRESMCRAYWASGLNVSCEQLLEFRDFTTMRQTVVLFMAAMNGEL